MERAAVGSLSLCSFPGLIAAAESRHAELRRKSLSEFRHSLIPQQPSLLVRRRLTAVLQRRDIQSDV